MSNEHEEDAAREHVREKLSIRTSEKELGERYGFGIEFYFIFTRYLAVLNLILGLFGFIGFGPTLKDGDSNLGLQALFFTSFPVSLRSYWRASSIIQTTIFFVAGLMYFFFVRIVSRKRILTHENAFVVDTIAAERIAGNQHYGFWTRWMYRVISYSILLGLTALSIYVTWALQGVYKEDQSTNLSVVNFLLVIFIKLGGTIFGLICGFLTILEKHRTESGYKVSHVIKIFFYKVAIVFGLNLTTGIKGGYNNLLLLLMDLIVWRTLELILPVVKAKVFKLLKFTAELSDEKGKPEFDVATEMIGLFYRQFIVFSAVSIFPIVGILAFIIVLFEYPLDKFKLLKMCQEPRRVNHTMTGFIVVLLTLTAVTALFSPYSILNLNKTYYDRPLMTIQNGEMQCLVNVCYFDRDPSKC